MSARSVERPRCNVERHRRDRIRFGGQEHGGPADDNYARAGEPRAARFRPCRFRSVSPAPQVRVISSSDGSSGALGRRFFFASSHSNRPDAVKNPVRVLDAA